MKEYPSTTQEQLGQPMTESEYWDWICACAEVGNWDDQLENLRNTGHLGRTIPEYEEKK